LTPKVKLLVTPKVKLLVDVFETNRSWFHKKLADFIQNLLFGIFICFPKKVSHSVFLLIQQKSSGQKQHKLTSFSVGQDILQIIQNEHALVNNSCFCTAIDLLWQQPASRAAVTKKDAQVMENGPHNQDLCHGTAGMMQIRVVTTLCTLTHRNKQLVEKK